MPAFSGRILLATRNPTGLVAMAQAFLGGVNFKLTNDGKPVALPENLTGMVGQPGWAAMSDNAVVVGIGAGEDAKLGEMLKATTGDSGRIARMYINGDMYRSWVALMADKAGSMAEASATAASDAMDADDAVAEKARASAMQRSKAQFDAMRAQAERIVSAAGEAHVDDDGLVITGKNEVK
jgi:hypothetical protein